LTIAIFEEGYIVDTKDAIRQQFMKEYGKKDFAAIEERISDVSKSSISC
jgi:hypothetical protein